MRLIFTLTLFSLLTVAADATDETLEPQGHFRNGVGCLRRSIDIAGTDYQRSSRQSR